MILSDRSIKKAVESGRLIIDPYDEALVQPVSVDLTLGDKLRIFRSERYPSIDVKIPQPELTEELDMDKLNPLSPFLLHPNQFVLGITREFVQLPNDLMGRLDGKSSLGRLGLLVHSTAGFVDPGFRGRLVLEFSNVAPLPITLYAGMRIAQISFYELTEPVARPYGDARLDSKYQDQDGPTPSRYYLIYQHRVRSKMRSQRNYESTRLRDWLEESQFKGNVKQFAEHIGVLPKAVEEWVYGRGKPSPKHFDILFEVTRLEEFSSLETRLQLD